MKVKVLTFAGLKEHFEPEFTIDINESSIVQNVIDALVASKPSSSILLKSCMVAVNNTMESLNKVLKEGDTVLVLPPVGGG